MFIKRDLLGSGAVGSLCIVWAFGDSRCHSLVNYEGGSEHAVAQGGETLETLTEWGSYPFTAGSRDGAMESMYGEKARMDVWRTLVVLDKHSVRGNPLRLRPAIRSDSGSSAEDCGRRARSMQFTDGEKSWSASPKTAAPAHTLARRLHLLKGWGA